MVNFALLLLTIVFVRIHLVVFNQFDLYWFLVVTHFSILGCKVLGRVNTALLLILVAG